MTRHHRPRSQQSSTIRHHAAFTFDANACCNRHSRHCPPTFPCSAPRATTTNAGAHQYLTHVTSVREQGGGGQLHAVAMDRHHFEACALHDAHPLLFRSLPIRTRICAGSSSVVHACAHQHWHQKPLRNSVVAVQVNVSAMRHIAVNVFGWGFGFDFNLEIWFQKRAQDI